MNPTIETLLRECLVCIEAETYDRELVKRVKAALAEPADSTTDKVAALLARCKCGVDIRVNAHRTVYRTVAQEIAQHRELADFGCCPFDIPDDPTIVAEMIKRDTVVELQFYPDTPIGFYSIVHYDLDAALDQALSALAE